MTILLASGLAYWLAPAARHSAWTCFSCGLVTATVGFALMIWAWAEFKKSKNPICPTERPTTFITSGPFRLSRNPMYLGMIVMLFGPAAWLGSPLFLLSPVVFFAIIVAVFVPHEEQNLREAFGERYADYSAQVRRWL